MRGCEREKKLCIRPQNTGLMRYDALLICKIVTYFGAANCLQLHSVIHEKTFIFLQPIFR